MDLKFLIEPENTEITQEVSNIKPVSDLRSLLLEPDNEVKPFLDCNEIFAENNNNRKDDKIITPDKSKKRTPAKKSKTKKKRSQK